MSLFHFWWRETGLKRKKISKHLMAGYLEHFLLLPISLIIHETQRTDINLDEKKYFHKCSLALYHCLLALNLY